MSDKKRRVVSYENMDEVLAAAFAEKYPKGQSDYLTDLAKYTKPDGSVFYAVSLETDDCIALIKIQIDVDAPEDIEKWLNDQGDDEDEGDDAGNLPDDNISDYANGEDDSVDSE